MSTQTTCDQCGEVNPADIHTCTPKRPPNCGTSYCSCVECVMEPPAAQPAPVQEQFHVISHDCAERGCMAHDDRIDGPGVVIPQQPALKPLTDEQIKAGWRTLPIQAPMSWSAYHAGARMAEAAHGIKGAA